MSAHVEANAIAMRDFANRLSQALTFRNRNDYEIGWFIDEAIRNQLWSKWPEELGGPFKTLEAWCWHFLHFGHHKAKKLAQNYLHLRALNLSPDVISRALRIGWTKLAHILRVARTENALIQWLDHVEEHKLTELDLRVETGKLTTVSGMPPRTAVQPVVEAAPTPAAKPIRRIKWSLVFEDNEALDIFKTALNVVKTRLHGIGDGKAAALIATHYMGVLARNDEGGVAVELEAILESIERTYGVFVIVSERPPPAPPSRTDAAADFS
jgi:hypothetical protein